MHLPGSVRSAIVVVRCCLLDWVWPSSSSCHPPRHHRHQCSIVQCIAIGCSPPNPFLTLPILTGVIAAGWIGIPLVLQLPFLLPLIVSSRWPRSCCPCPQSKSGQLSSQRRRALRNICWDWCGLPSRWLVFGYSHWHGMLPSSYVLMFVPTTVAVTV